MREQKKTQFIVEKYKSIKIDRLGIKIKALDLLTTDLFFKGEILLRLQNHPCQGYVHTV